MTAQFVNICILLFVFFFFSGVQKGDRVAIYMPMIIELVVAMLACARIGAVHSIVVSENNYYSLFFVPSK